MNKMNKLAVVAAVGLTFAGAVQAQTYACPSSGAAVIGERVVTTTTTTRTVGPANIPAVAVSGTTLSGRREIISNNAVVDGTSGRVVFTDGAGRTTSRPIRGYVSPGALTPAEQSIAFGGTGMCY